MISRISRFCLERSGPVIECLTRDRGATGSSLTGATALWSLSKTHFSSLVLVHPRKTRPCLTERLLMERKESNQTNIEILPKLRQCISYFQTTVALSYDLAKNHK